MKIGNQTFDDKWYCTYMSCDTECYRKYLIDKCGHIQITLSKGTPDTYYIQSVYYISFQLEAKFLAPIYSLTNKEYKDIHSELQFENMLTAQNNIDSFLKRISNLIWAI